MNKKAFIDGFSFIAFIIVTIGIAGATFAFLTPEKIQQYPYVGNSVTKQYFPISCLDKIPSGDRILFETERLAINNNFTISECK
jgi:hypothetical protein